MQSTCPHAQPSLPLRTRVFVPVNATDPLTHYTFGQWSSLRQTEMTLCAMKRNCNQLHFLHTLDIFNTGIVGSNPCWGMVMCPCFVFCPVYVKAFSQSDSLSKVLECLIQAGDPWSLHLHPEDRGAKVLRNVGILSHRRMVSQSRRPRLESSSPWKLPVSRV
jgi:hypothetical protein